MDPWTEEWNQQRAERRSIETMRRIALDAMEFGDDNAAFSTYTAEHNLTVNEVVYYLNAYEYGGEAGLRAIRNPDIIPPDVAGQAITTIAACWMSASRGDCPTVSRMKEPLSASTKSNNA